MDAFDIKIQSKINDNFAVQLVEILNTDSELQNTLGSNKNKISKSHFIEHNREWIKKTNSEMFAITLDNIAIGLISLSHQNIVEQKAQVGYWISSKHWGKGYTTQAFSQLLDYAKIKGIKYLNARIKKDIIASKRIWEKYDAKIELKSDKFWVSIEL